MNPTLARLRAQSKAAKGCGRRGKPPMSKLSYGFVSALALALASAGCARTGLSKAEVSPEPGHEPTVLAHPALTQVGGGVSIADVAERVLPSVVTVSTTVVQRQQPSMFPFFGGPPSERQGQG